ncbi:MAG: hypothetical protein CMH12_13515 [Maritimibacter sp.]|nr:hypothetical protein [Maritimibacter sp.]
MELTVFEDARLLARGTVADVAAKMQSAVARGGSVLAFDDATGKVVDLDLRGTPQEVAARHAEAPARRGRPKLGVKAREVTLLPRHWDWLSGQRGGASATLRRLVEQAMRGESATSRQAQDAAYSAATALAGDRPGYEEAMRALFAGDTGGMQVHMAAWPEDIRDYVGRLLQATPA